MTVPEDFRFLFKTEDQFTQTKIDVYFNSEEQTVLLNLNDTKQVGPLSLGELKTLRLSIEDLMWQRGIRN